MGFWDKLGEFAAGTPAQLHQVNRFSPEVQTALQQLLGQGMQGLQNPTQGFQPIENQARANFNQQTIPSLAERFTGFTGGASSSPSFISQLGQAGAGLDTNLAALKSQYGLQNQAQMMQLLGMATQPQFENYMQPGQEGFLQAALPAFGRAGMAALGGSALGGTGGGIMSALMSLLGGGSSSNQSQQSAYPWMPSSYRQQDFSLFNNPSMMQQPNYQQFKNSTLN